MKRWLPYIPLVIIIGYVGYIFIKDARKEPISPRDMKGATILETIDSVYYITFKIDTVIQKEYEPEDNRP